MKLMGLAITLAGILVAALDEFGFLQSRDRISFYEQVFHSQQTIPRQTKGFDAFLSAFPPPREIPATAVKGIAPRMLTVDNGGEDVWSSIRYMVESGERTEVVANQADVQNWAFHTTGVETGLAVAFAGFLLGAVDYLRDLRARKSRVGFEPNTQ